MFPVIVVMWITAFFAGTDLQRGDSFGWLNLLVSVGCMIFLGVTLQDREAKK